MFASRVPRFTQPRLEVYSIKFIKKKNNSNNNNNNNNNNATDDEFKGIIYIADGSRFHEFYNSEKAKDYNLLYTDHQLPRTNMEPKTEEDPVLELRGTNEGEEEVPVMGPHAALIMSDFCLVVVHNDTGNPTKYNVNKAPSYLPCFYGDDCDNWKPLVFGHPLKCADVPFDIEVDGPFRSLKLNCVIFRDSKVVRVQVKWIPHQKSGSDTNSDDTDNDDIYILGKISLSSPGIGICGYESILFETPTNKVMKTSVRQPIPLLKSVVTIPYHSDFILAANLQVAPAIDDVNDDSSAAIVNGIVRFSQPLYDECPDEFFDGFNLPGFDVQAFDDEDFRAKRRKYFGSIFHKSFKHISGNDADIEVTVIVDVM